MANGRNVNNNWSPQFADLLYAVVVGGSFGLIQDLNDYVLVAEKVFLILIVLEDWYSYFRFVKPVIVDAQRYTWYSFLAEFVILMSWYLAIVALNSPMRQNGMFLCIAVFFLFRFITGVRFHYKRRSLGSVQGITEFFYLLQAIISAATFWVVSIPQATFGHAFIVFAIALVVITAGWWIIRLKWP